MRKEIETDTYKAVGPYINLYGHGPVTGVAPEAVKGWELLFCLDCGYTTGDLRMFAHEDCDREENGINQTWREFLDENDYPTFSEPDDE